MTPGPDNAAPGHEHVLFIFAHPDDETFGCGGLLALLRDQGATTSYVVATRGEAGEIRVPGLATPATLGAVRERELRRALDLLGVNELRLLGYRDSGMAGTAPNDDPRAFIQADRDEVVAHLVGHIRELRPSTVVTFGPDGIYGHPDHILISELTIQALDEAADPDRHPGLGEPWTVPSLFFTAIPRERVIAHAAHESSPFHAMPADVLATFGSPEAEITHRFDLHDYLATKRNAMLCHRTQIAPGGAFDPEVIDNADRFWTWEYLRRVRGTDGDSPILARAAQRSTAVAGDHAH